MGILQGERISTIDLFDRDFTLPTSPTGHPWCEAGSLVAGRLGLSLHTYRVGEDGDVRDTNQDWATTYGVGEDGAVLVRPDRYVAWRSAMSTKEPRVELERVLQAVLGHELHY